MTEPIKIPPRPVRIQARPFAHLLGWILRRGVPTDDIVPRYWLTDEVSANRVYRERYEAERKKIDNLLTTHIPQLRDPEKLASGWDGHPLEFTCAAPNCPYMWPCPSWAWANGHRYSPLRVNLKDFRITEPEATE